VPNNKLKAKTKQDMKNAEAYEKRQAFQVKSIAVIDHHTENTFAIPVWTITGRIYDDIVMPLLRTRKKS